MKDWIYVEISGKPTLIVTRTLNGIDYNVAIAIDYEAASHVQRLLNKPVDNSTTD